MDTLISLSTFVGVSTPCSSSHSDVLANTERILSLSSSVVTLFSSESVSSRSFVSNRNDSNPFWAFSLASLAFSNSANFLNFAFASFTTSSGGLGRSIGEISSRTFSLTTVTFGPFGLSASLAVLLDSVVLFLISVAFCSSAFFSLWPVDSVFFYN